jgi:16S rRNA (guanine527-N7)-methyltransferase
MERLQEILSEGAKELDIRLSERQVRQFLAYLEILLSWNKRMNLTSLEDPEEIIVSHFLDSLTIFKVIDSHNGISALDIGSGAGFPGIPLKIINPEISLALLDASRKKTEFLRYLAKSLELEDLEVIWGRAEEYGRKKEYRQRYDLVLARALAKLNTLAELGIPFLKVGGLFIAQKGEKLTLEADEAKQAIEILGGNLKGIISLKLPFSQALRKLVIIDKIAETSPKFPRRSGIPRKRPLK